MPFVVRIRPTSGSGCWRNFSSALATRGGIDDHFILPIALFQLFKIAFQCFTFANASRAAYGVEFRAINGNPLTLH